MFLGWGGGGGNALDSRTLTTSNKFEAAHLLFFSSSFLRLFFQLKPSPLPPELSLGPSFSATHNCIAHRDSQLSFQDDTHTPLLDAIHHIFSSISVCVLVTPIDVFIHPHPLSYITFTRHSRSYSSLSNIDTFLHFMFLVF